MPPKYDCITCGHPESDHDEMGCHADMDPTWYNDGRIRCECEAYDPDRGPTNILP